jgi:hypothetical protein
MKCSYENCPFVHWKRFGFESGVPCKMGDPEQRWKGLAAECPCRKVIEFPLSGKIKDECILLNGKEEK